MLRTVVLVTLLVPLLVDVPVVVAVCVALEGSCIGTPGGIGDPKTGSSFSLQVNFCAETCLATSHALLFARAKRVKMAGPRGLELSPLRTKRISSMQEIQLDPCQ